MSSRFLGLDLSTQGLTAVVIDTQGGKGKVVLQRSIHFGSDLPEFGCPCGVLPNDDPLVRHSNPLMWVAALEKLLLTCMEVDKFDWGTVSGVSGSGQQHGSVYLRKEFFNALQFTTSMLLVDQLQPVLSRRTSPVWMDSSTSLECREIGAALGGDDIVREISGSVPIERFTGPQIRKFYKTEPHLYSETARIHLVSSFMACVISGSDAPIDMGDGAGMNLLNLRDSNWDARLLHATAPNLRERLPSVAQRSGTIIGSVAHYFVEKYGFNPNAKVVAWSGDNPCSLVGMGATRPGTAVISLGTSDTLFAAMSKPETDPNGNGNVFGNPAGGFMCLMCYKNGSLAREKVAKMFNLDWAQFSKGILSTSPGNNGRLLLPYFEPEITPRILQPKALIVDLSATNGCCGVELSAATQSADVAARAVVETQMLSLRLHSSWISERPSVIRVTGGASKNNSILRVAADVFGTPLERIRVSNSACLGAALMAANGVGGHSWGSLFERFCTATARVMPNLEVSGVYERALDDLQRALSMHFGIIRHAPAPRREPTGRRETERSNGTLSKL